MRKRLALYVRVTKNCNAKCFMCSFWENKTYEFITDIQFARVLEKAVKEGVRLVRFTGGEPLLCKKLSVYVRHCHSLGLKTSVITNGLLLPQQLDRLVASGLDQIVLSIDGSTAELHNAIRGTEGLFEKIECAMGIIRERYPLLRVRANTVASMRNIQDLSKLAVWLGQYGFTQWSIIPIKFDGFCWAEHIPFGEFMGYYRIFQKVAGKSGIELMGYSGQWAGTDDESCRCFWSGDELIHPREKCGLVRLISFYDPFTDRYYPCNCMPHRNTELAFDNSEKEAEWYYENGSRYCTGCEPLNAYCADFPESMEEDIFNY